MKTKLQYINGDLCSEVMRTPDWAVAKAVSYSLLHYSIHSEAHPKHSKEYVVNVRLPQVQAMKGLKNDTSR